ncbi:unnamed protein product [Phaeothamnion confervicola]
MLISARSPDLVAVVEAALTTGSRLAIDDVGSSLDPALDAVVRRQSYRRGGRVFVRVAGREVQWRPGFRLQLRSEFADPGQLRGACAETNAVSFGATAEAVEEQLLAEVVRLERPELERRHWALAASIAQDRRQLLRQEENLLRLLNDNRKGGDSGGGEDVGENGGGSGSNNGGGGGKESGGSGSSGTNGKEISDAACMDPLSARRSGERRREPGRSKRDRTCSSAASDGMSPRPAHYAASSGPRTGRASSSSGGVRGKRDASSSATAAIDDVAAATVTAAPEGTAPPALSILDDEELVEALARGKASAAAVERRITEAEATGAQMRADRELYRPVARRLGLLYRCVDDLGRVETAYAQSLRSFARVVMRAVAGCPGSDCVATDDDGDGGGGGGGVKGRYGSINTATVAAASGVSAGPAAKVAAIEKEALERRVAALKSWSTEAIFASVQRGVFERHKPLFAFLLAGEVAREEKIVSAGEWSLLFSGPRLDRRRSSYCRSGSFSIAAAAASTAMPRKSRLRAGSGGSGACAMRSATAAASTVNPDPSALDERSWASLQQAEAAVTAMTGVVAAVAANWPRWRDWRADPAAHKAPLPGGWEKRLSPFQKLLVINALAKPCVHGAAMSFVGSVLGRHFIPGNDGDGTDGKHGSDGDGAGGGGKGGGVGSFMDGLLADMDCATPCLFLLSPGVDPIDVLRPAAVAARMDRRLHVVSLGQGQGAAAEAVVAAARRSGNWVLLQNCHLARSWLPTLERLVALGPEEESAVDPGFRLFLSAFPVPYLPAGVVRRAVKACDEPPRGIRANLRRSYRAHMLPMLRREGGDDGSIGFSGGAGIGGGSGDDSGVLNGIQRPKEWRRLLFGLCFFHAVVQERAKYGALGWNVAYDFGDSDLATAMQLLGRYIDAHCDADGGSSSKESDGGGSGRDSNGSGSSGRGGGKGPPEANMLSWLPIDSLVFMTGNITYGGRVTDDWDSRCMLAILDHFYHAALHGGLGDASSDGGSGFGFCGSSSGGGNSSCAGSSSKGLPRLTRRLSASSAMIAAAPAGAAPEQYGRYIEQLPSEEGAEMFGMHASADASVRLRDGQRLLGAVLALQPREAAVSSGQTPDEAVATAAADMLAKLPAPLAHRMEGAVNSLTRRKTDVVANAASGATAGAAVSGLSAVTNPAVAMAAAALNTIPAAAAVMAPPASTSQKPALERVASSDCAVETAAAATTTASAALAMPPPPLYDARNSMAVVLVHEADYCNALLVCVRADLAALQSALRGDTLMGPRMDALYRRLLLGRVPEEWSGSGTGGGTDGGGSGGSLKSLAVWAEELSWRVGFFQDWLERGAPHAFALPAFFFPRAFLTAVLQRHARRHTVAINLLSFGFHFPTPYATEESSGGDCSSAAEAAARAVAESLQNRVMPAVAEPPCDGVYIYGLYLEGAAWDCAVGRLVEPPPGHRRAPAPLIHLLPEANRPPPPPEDVSGCYMCPCYRTPERRGVTSTSGANSNFVLAVEFPAEAPSRRFVLHGAALLCSDD